MAECRGASHVRVGMRLRIAVVLPCLLLPWLVASSTGAAAAEIDVAVAREGPAVVITAQARLRADAATAWRVLTDYERYVDFVPGLTQSEVVAREGHRVTVAQHGTATWLLLRWPLDAVYDVEERPAEGLRSHAVAARGVLDSAYTLSRTSDGVCLAYRGVLMPAERSLGVVERAMGERAVEHEFRALAGEIERQAAHGRAVE